MVKMLNQIKKSINPSWGYLASNQKLANDLISGESINIVSEDNKIKLKVKMLPEQVRLLAFRND